MVVYLCNLNRGPAGEIAMLSFLKDAMMVFGILAGGIFLVLLFMSKLAEWTDPYRLKGGPVFGKLIKYFKLFGLFKNVQKSYKEETGKDRPAYLSRRFIGAVIIVGGAVLSLELGVKIDESLLTDITNSIEKIVAAGIVLYGLVMEIVGIVKRKKK